jgi:hypothetical protein
VQTNFDDNSVTNIPQGVQESQYQAVVNQRQPINASVGPQHVHPIPI